MTTVPFWTLACGTADCRVEDGGVGDTDGGSGFGGRTDSNSDNRLSKLIITINYTNIILWTKYHSGAKGMYEWVNSRLLHDES